MAYAPQAAPASAQGSFGRGDGWCETYPRTVFPTPVRTSLDAISYNSVSTRSESAPSVVRQRGGGFLLQRFPLQMGVPTRFGCWKKGVIGRTQARVEFAFQISSLMMHCTGANIHTCDSDSDSDSDSDGDGKTVQKVLAVEGVTHAQ